MESDPKVELAEVDRLASRAQAAASDYPETASMILTAAEIVLVATFFFVGWSKPLIAAWVVFFPVFHYVLWRRRSARPRAPWATAEARRRLGWATLTTIGLNALWIPLFIFFRSLALAVLLVALVLSFVSAARRQRGHTA